jgi:hypothetical protein
LFFITNVIARFIYSLADWLFLSDHIYFCHCILTLTHWQASLQPDIFVVVNFGVVIAV